MDERGDTEETEYERYLREREIRKANKGKPKPRKPLKRGTSQLKRTRLNPVSKKQKKRNADYKKAREVHYASESNRVCAICGTSEHLSIHHKSGRGSETANVETFVTLCMYGDTFDRLFPELNPCSGMGCHQGVEANKAWARDNGYLDT